MIRLERINQHNVNDCLELSVKNNQLKYCSSTEKSLAKAFVYFNQASPFVIYNDQQPVGFILLRFNPYSNNYFIWNFLIDQKHQGKGYGKQALQLAIDWIKMDPRCNEVVITHKKENEVAAVLYRKFGFQVSETLDDDVNLKLIY